MNRVSDQAILVTGAKARMFSVPLFCTFSPRCCRNVTVANRRCDTVRAVLTARIMRSHGSYHGARGGSRNEPTLWAAHLLLDRGHARLAFERCDSARPPQAHSAC